MSDEAAAEVSPIEKAYEVIVAGSAIAGTSTQKKPGSTTPDDAIIPPLPLDALAALSAISSVRGACIEAIARNVVGLGYDVIPREHGAAAGDLQERRKELIDTLEALASRDSRLSRPSFSQQLFAVKTDEEEVGLGGLEVSRNKTTGEIDGLFHLPGKRLRRRKDLSGWFLVNDPREGQIDNQTQFCNFGEKVDYNADGTPTAKLATNRKWEENEVLVFRLYSSESRDYGLPRDHALALEYAADKLAAESNVSFFDSNGVPPTIIFVSGETIKDGVATTITVPSETVNRIISTVKSDSGHKKAVAVIPLPAGAKADKMTLAVRSDKDIGNNEFRAGIAGRTLGAFRLGAVFVPGVTKEATGRYTAEVERALALEQVFDPEQTKYEGALDQVLRDLGFADLRVDFVQLKVEGDAAKRDAANALATTQAITNAEQRQANGYGRLPEHDTDDEVAAAAAGKVPKGWNDRLVIAPKSAQQQPFGGANDGPVAPNGDQRGLRPGVGARKKVRDEVGADGQPLAKGGDHGDPDTDERIAELEVEFLELSEDGIGRAMKRTYALAEVVAGRVTEDVAKMQAELDARVPA